MKDNDNGFNAFGSIKVQMPIGCICFLIIKVSGITFLYYLHNIHGIIIFYPYRIGIKNLINLIPIYEIISSVHLAD